MVTIKEVADAAGVSISTVSYALSGKRPIGESTRRRIEAAVAALNYSPNAGARMLAGSRTNIIALAAPLPGGGYSPAHMIFVLAIGEAARDLDCDVLMLTRGEALRGLRRVAASSLVDGIIMMDVTTDDVRVSEMRGLGVATTWVGVPGDSSDLYCVDVDFERAGALAIERLAELGHRQIGIIGYPRAVYDRKSNFAERLAASSAAAARRLGIALELRAVEQNPTAIRNAYQELRAALPGMTGIVIHSNDPVPEMLVHILDEQGLSVPGDLSVVSVCTAFTTDPPPATDYIPWPAEEVSRMAVEMLAEQLAGNSRPRVLLVDPEYREVGTVAEPRRN